MLFSQLLAQAQLDDAPRHGDGPVGHVTIDSRRINKNDCFVAIRGAAVDGHTFIPAAVAAGASAIVCSDSQAVPPGVPFAVVPDTQRVVGPLAQASYGWPSHKLCVTGITGTNGKTTFTFLVRHVLTAIGQKAAMLGTINYELPDGRSIPAPNTTPDAVQLAEMMALAADAGAGHLVMEVSSHALDQGRVNGVKFAVAAFSNLTGDHLDYHGTMENYLAAKAKLFEMLTPDSVAVINRDDPAGKELAKRTNAARLWYGIDGPCDVRGEILSASANGSKIFVHHAGSCCAVHLKLVGRHNVHNCLAATAACLGLGLELPAILAALAQVEVVPGRLQRVASKAPFEVLVDYAHTDDALSNVLSALRAVTKGKLIVVFGCGGDRDRTKRPRMAKVASALADRVIVTSDNPRTEDPRAIIQEILTGFDSAGREKVQVESDRRVAIALALTQAQAGDVVLLAGKGHEDYQIIGREKHHFDDAEVAREVLEKRVFSS